MKDLKLTARGELVALLAAGVAAAGVWWASIMATWVIVG